MKKILLAMTLSLVSFLTGYAQNVQVIRLDGNRMSVSTVSVAKQKKIGKAVMEFMYDYRFLRDTTDVASVSTDRMILQVGHGISKFSSYRTMQVDSLMEVSTTDQVQAHPERYIGGQTYSIYKNYPAGNHYSFTCVGINSKADRAITLSDVPYNKTSRVKFYQTLYRYDTHPLGYLETVNGVKVNVTTNGKKRDDLNRPCELAYDYIETDWKDK